jgi:hypothetical protein
MWAQNFPVSNRRFSENNVFLKAIGINIRALNFIKPVRETAGKLIVNGNKKQF